MPDTIIDYLYSNNYYTVIGTFLSIIGFFVSLIILYYASNYKKRFTNYQDIKKFNLERKQSYNRLIGYKDLIKEDEILDLKLKSDISIEIEKYNNYKSLLNIVDKIKIFCIKRNLGKSNTQIDKSKLCIQLTYFISILGKDKEDFS